MTRAAARLQFVVTLGVLALCAGAWPVAQVVQSPPAPQAPVVGTGFISGQVIEVPSGRPVPEATVAMLARSPTPPVPGGRGGVQQQQVVADSQGRFYFARLPNGSYSFVAQKQGYETPRTASASIDLTDSGRITDIRIRLSPVSSISGTVRDTAGDPVVGTNMRAFRRAMVNGRQTWGVFGNAVTDDRGTYRMGQLGAGEYLVCACSRDPIPFDGQLLKTIASEPISLLSVAGRALTVGADVVSMDNTLKTYAPRFHPNSANVARAERIALAPGEDKTGVDVSLDMVRATRVSGRVVGAQGPVNASSVRLVPAGDLETGIEFTAIQPMVVQADGRFDFAPVPPGQYELVVRHRDVTTSGAGGPSGLAMGFVGPRGGAQPAVAMRMGGAGPVDPLLWANEPLSVGDNGVSGFTVALHAGLTVRGRLQYVGAAPQPPAQQFQRINVTMNPAIPTQTAPFNVGTIAQDGTFIVPNVIPGKYTVSVAALPGFPTLKSVVLGGQDITDMSIDVGEKDLTEMVITFVDTPMASLIVTTPLAGQPQMEELIAIVFPADRKFWPETFGAVRKFRQQAVSSKGAVTFPSLPAGDYFVAVVSSPENQRFPEPAYLEQLSRRAQRVTISDGGSQTVEVRR